jgi:rRNA-processing protein FCF1
MGKEEKVAKEKDVIPKIRPQSITRSSKKSRTSVIVDLDQIIPRSPSSFKSSLSPSKRGLEKFKNVKKATTSLQKTTLSSHHQEGKVQKMPAGLPSTSTANKPVASSSTASEDAMEWEPTESEVLNSVHQLRKNSSLPQTQITDIRYLHTSRLPVKQNNLIKTVVLHVVIDTNIFLSHLPVVKTLVEDSCQNKVQIFVPWMVLQELDLIKTKAEHKNKLEVMARKAAMFINIQTSILKNPCFRIQTLSEYNSCINLSSDENADDKILQWCINLKKEIQENILLLSNDIIFSAKASANGIQAMLSQDFVDQLPQLLTTHSRPSEAETNTSSSPVLDDSHAIPNTSTSQVLTEEKSNTDRVLPSKFLFQFEELVNIPFSQVISF